MSHVQAAPGIEDVVDYNVAASVPELPTKALSYPPSDKVDCSSAAING